MLIGGSLLALLLVGLMVGSVMTGSEDDDSADEGEATEPDDGVRIPVDTGEGSDSASDQTMVAAGTSASAEEGDDFGVHAGDPGGDGPPRITDWDVTADSLTIYYPEGSAPPALSVGEYSVEPVPGEGQEAETGTEIIGTDEIGAAVILRLPGVDPADVDLDAFTLEVEPASGIIDPGTDDDDIIIGTTGDDSLGGGDGDDQIIGGPGADTITGGPGDDALDGREGPDGVFGDAGVDAITGGAGADTLDGGQGDDYVFGNDGDDLILGQGGSDHLSGDRGNDVIEGGAGSDRLLGWEGDDILRGGSEADLMDGGDGDDTLEGGTGDDTLIGGMGADTLFGGSGMDVIDGTSGNLDFSFGPFDTDDADTLSGGDDTDLLIIGAGDVASGDGGDDIFAAGSWIGPEQAAGTITDFDPDADIIRLIVPETDTAPAITVTDFDDGTGAEIRLNGHVVLRAVGAQGLDPSAIEVVSGSLTNGPLALYA